MTTSLVSSRLAQNGSVPVHNSAYIWLKLTLTVGSLLALLLLVQSVVT